MRWDRSSTTCSSIKGRRSKHGIAFTVAVRRRDPRPGDRRFVPEARSARPTTQSRHVHLRSRRARHADLRDPRCHGRQTAELGFDIAISIWLWFTVVFANFAEAVAEGRGKAQAEFLRRTKTETSANRIVDGKVQVVSATQLRKGDRVRVDRRRTDSRRRRDRRRRGDGRRIGHHRRIGARHPRSRRRPQLRHRRHARALRFDRRSSSAPTPANRSSTG